MQNPNNLRFWNGTDMQYKIKTVEILLKRKTEFKKEEATTPIKNDQDI